MPTPKQIYEQNEVQVDPSKFEITRWFWELIKNANKHPWMSPNFYLVRLLFLAGILLLWRLMRIPIEWYYDWKDPLISGEQSVALGTAEELRERAKYKKRDKSWNKEAV